MQDAQQGAYLELIKRISLLLAIFLSSCGPIKGYEGPDMPREQLGLIKLGTPICDKCRIGVTQAGSVEFFSRGVLLLPGKYFLRSKVVSWGEPYNCHIEHYYDSATYDSCERDRLEAIRKERNFYRSCESEADRSKEVCSINFAESECSGNVEVISNQELEIVAKVVNESEESLAPGVVNVLITPSLSVGAQKELTKLHTNERLVTPESQELPYCNVIRYGVW